MSLDETQVELLRKTKELIEQLLETLDIMSDQDAMNRIKEAEEDIKAGRTRNYEEFIRELKEAGEI